jgi:hypothetical protein
MPDDCLACPWHMSEHRRPYSTAIDEMCQNRALPKNLIEVRERRIKTWYTAKPRRIRPPEWCPLKPADATDTKG